MNEVGHDPHYGKIVKRQIKAHIDVRRINNPIKRGLIDRGEYSRPISLHNFRHYSESSSLILGRKKYFGKISRAYYRFLRKFCVGIHFADIFSGSRGISLNTSRKSSLSSIVPRYRLGLDRCVL